MHNTVIISHPTGNANVRAAVKALADRKLLNTFYTGVGVFPNSLLYKLSHLSMLAELRKRALDSSVQRFTRLHPFREVGRLLSARLKLSNFTRHENGYFCIDQVYLNLDRHISGRLHRQNQLRTVFAYEDGALSSFEKAAVLGMNRIYELPIGYWRSAIKLMKPEIINRPEWAETITIFKDSETKLIRKDRELELASQILVASNFTASTLKDYPGKLGPVKVIPYGFPNVGSPKEYRALSGRKLRMLFVGSLSQRKGIASLFEAVNMFPGRIELTVVGMKSSDDCPALNTELAKHRWIPALPHNEILSLMKASDVLAFPSLFEGFGLVITEAMSQGTPVITTERTAGPDLIRNNESGWLIDAGSTEHLAACIEDLLCKPGEVKLNGANAYESAARRPWSVYGDELCDYIESVH